MDTPTFLTVLQLWFNPFGRVSPPCERRLPFWSLRDTPLGLVSPPGPLEQIEALLNGDANAFVSLVASDTKTTQMFGREWPIETLMFRGEEGDAFDGGSTRLTLIERMMESCHAPTAAVLDARKVLPWSGIGYPLSWIHLAALNNDVNVLPLLHRQGMDLQQADPKGRTLLHLMVGSPACLKWLLQTVHLDIKARNKAGQTALHTAADDGGSLESVRELLQAGADIKARDKKGATALHKASSLEVARLLVQHGARLESLDKMGKSPVDVWTDRRFDFDGDSPQTQVWTQMIKDAPKLRELSLAYTLPQPKAPKRTKTVSQTRHRF